MQFQPQNDLERSLMRAATEPAHRPRFLRDFLDSEILTINMAPAPGPDGPRVAGQGESVSIPTVEWNGTPCLPVFTSLPRLQATIEHEVSTLAMRTRDFLEMTRGANLILNPGSEYGKEFPAGEVAALLDGSIWGPQSRETIQAETKVLLGQPRTFPRELAKVLSHYFKGRKQVKRAYLALMKRSTDEAKPNTVIGIEATGDWDEILADLGPVIASLEIPDPPIDFIQLKPETGGTFESYFLDNCEPFYKKALFGF